MPDEGWTSVDRTLLILVGIVAATACVLTVSAMTIEMVGKIYGVCP